MPDKYQLPSGDIAELEYPDTWVIFSQVGNIPDPLVAKVLKLLELEGVALPEGTNSTWKHMADKQLGLFGIYKWCRKDKTLDLTIEHGDNVTTLGRLDVRHVDLEYVYYNFFRAGNAVKVIENSHTTNIRGIAELTPDMQRLQYNAVNVSETANGVELITP
jgi:hypothetical protein